MNQEHPDRPSIPDRPASPDDRIQAQDKPRRRQLPPYRVILHQDIALDMMFVVRTVMELTRFCRAEATHKMWQAYHSGRALLLITYKERAELYVEQFASRGVTVTIEPA
jgi:ATP-dependent Clp protease adapter protein ClpS